MVPERKRDGNFMKDRKIHVDSNVVKYSSKILNICRLDVHVGLN